MPVKRIHFNNVTGGLYKLHHVLTKVSSCSFHKSCSIHWVAILKPLKDVPESSSAVDPYIGFILDNQWSQIMHIETSLHNKYVAVGVKCNFIRMLKKEPTRV